MSTPTRRSPTPVDNPFATRYTRPTAGQYLFPEGVDARLLVARLRESGWWGQIIGPHGSGKSTLVQTLVPHLQAAGRTVEVHAHHSPSLSAGSSRLAIGQANATHWNSATQIVIDGYEQLGWLQRTWLKWQCRRHRAGLLATAHNDVGLPQLWRTEASAEMTRRIVTRLLGEADAPWLQSVEIERLFAANRGNVREVLFGLYDLYEQHQRETPSKSRSPPDGGR